MTDADSVGDSSGLLLFAWIQDHFFEPHRLRDTATYVLRFLTCLSSDIICCLSADDVNTIENEVKYADVSDDDDDFLSYSVAFHVEKQEEQKDGIHCLNVSEIDTEDFVKVEHDVKLLKGSFCAIAIQKKTQAATTQKKHFRRNFFPNSELSFAQWFLEKRQCWSIHLSPAIKNNSYACETVLRHSKQWPKCEIDKCHEVYEASLREVESQLERIVDLEIADKRSSALDLYDVLFEMENQDNAFTVREAIKSFRAWLSWARLVCKGNAPMMMKAELPNQLRKVLNTMET